MKLQELYEYCQLGDVDLAPEEYIANRLTAAERDKFEKDGYIIVVSSLETVLRANVHSALCTRGTVCIWLYCGVIFSPERRV